MDKYKTVAKKVIAHTENAIDLPWKLSPQILSRCAMHLRGASHILANIHRTVKHTFKVIVAKPYN